MNYTFSSHALTTIRERGIHPEWIEQTMAAPMVCRPHPDDPSLTEAFRMIPEFGNRVLRIIYNHDKQPPHIVTAYFDRTMKGKL